MGFKMDDSTEIVKLGILVIVFLTVGVAVVAFLAGMTSGTTPENVPSGVVWLIPIGSMLALALIAYKKFVE
jgi:hypothetical protein